jgi:hypothetical protein
MYGSEVWTLSQGAANKMDSLNGKSFQRYLDPPSPNGCGELGTVMSSVKCTRMWPFQDTYIREIIVRMEHRIPNKALRSCFGGRRPVERPRNRW